MGFRSRRRHKGGGGGGGGHHGGGQAFAFTGEANGLQPGDDVGNKKSFKPVIVPPEDIGNRRDPDEDEHIPFDDVGNRVEANPTHEISGVLLDLDPKKRKGRARGNAAPIERNGRYVIGGVNPLIAGGNRPPPPPPADDGWDAPQQQQQHQQQQRPQQQQQQQQQPRSEKKKRFEQVDGAAAQEVSEKRAQRFFDFDEDDRFDYTLKSTPEQKRKEALRFVDDILRESGRNASVKARVIDDGDKPKLIVTIDEKGPHARVERLGEGSADPLFVMGNGALLSLNYLANKVVNRYPDDRIRLAVLPASDEPLYLESLDEHQKRKRGETVSSEATSPSTALPADAPLALEIAVTAPVEVAPVVVDAVEAAPAPAPKKGKKAAVVDAPVAAPVAPAAPVVEPVVEPDVEINVDGGPKKKASRRKPKKGEELIPPPSAATLAAIEAGPAAVVAEVEAPAPVEVVAEAPEPEAAAEPEAPKGRRRAPPLEEPMRVRAPLDDGPRGGGPPRGRPRRGPSMVEVVRVTKKT